MYKIRYLQSELFFDSLGKRLRSH